MSACLPLISCPLVLMMAVFLQSIISIKCRVTKKKEKKKAKKKEGFLFNKRNQYALFKEGMFSQVHNGNSAFSTALVHFIIVS